MAGGFLFFAGKRRISAGGNINHLIKFGWFLLLVDSQNRADAGFFRDTLFNPKEKTLDNKQDNVSSLSIEERPKALVLRRIFTIIGRYSIIDSQHKN